MACHFRATPRQDRHRDTPRSTANPIRGSQALRAQQGPHDATTKLSGQPEVSGRHLNDVPSEQHSEPLLDCGDLVGTCELDRAVSDPPEGALLDLGSLEAR